MRWKTFNLILDGFMCAAVFASVYSSPRWNDVPTVIPIVVAVLAAIATYWVLGKVFKR